MRPSLNNLLYATALSGVCVNAQNITTTKNRGGAWNLRQEGMSGVSGQQIAIMSDTTAIIYDKVEHNPLQTRNHSAWAAEYDLQTNSPRPLHPVSNSWCAGGAHLSNGTLVTTGGNPIAIPEFGDTDGTQSIRLFDGCQDKSCDVFEDQNTVRLTSPRWYPSVTRLPDGSALVFGGSTTIDFINHPEINNPSYEFFPPKNINGFNGLKIPSKFMVDTLNGNHFPIMFLLPSGLIFTAANTKAMLFNWKTNTETRLPDIPNGVRITSPFSAAAALLPLSPPNYTPTVVICGGSTIDDKTPTTQVSSQVPASDQCIRMTLDSAGIKKGWEVDHMPEARIMGDFILLPDGRVVLVNGAGTGAAGFGTAPDPIGQSDADHPRQQALVYDPSAPKGSRFSSEGIPESPIPRMYHSVAMLTPNATILITGSNPNDDVTTVMYPSEYRVEHLAPAYMSQERPSYKGLPHTIDFGKKFTLDVKLPKGVKGVSVSLMDLGFSTHGVHMNQRLVHLESKLSRDGSTVTITAPPNPQVYPPGPAFLYLLTDAGVPSFGHRFLVGKGQSPPVDHGAIKNLLTHTKLNSTQPGSGGSGTQTGSGGNSTQIGSGGNSTQIGSGGNSTQTGSGGNGTQPGSGGNH